MASLLVVLGVGRVEGVFLLCVVNVDCVLSLQLILLSSLLPFFFAFVPHEPDYLILVKHGAAPAHIWEDALNKLHGLVKRS